MVCCLNNLARSASVGFATREEQFRWLLLARSLWELPVKVYMLTEG